QAVQADFALTRDNAGAVVEVCHRLDGSPLAIELAAARVRLFSPAALVNRLSSRLDVLTTGARDAPTRHQTLRGAIAWSYDLLTAPQQRQFEGLAVFAGGCTLEAAEAVANPNGVLGMSTLDGVNDLVTQSLLRRIDGASDEPRFALPETIREYALERLANSGAEVDTRDCHAAYFLALAEAAEPQLSGRGQAEWLARLEREHDNLRAALRWLVEHGDPEIGLRLCAALWRFWYMHGHLTEGRERLAELLALSDASAVSEAPAAVRAAALGGLGSFAWR